MRIVKRTTPGRVLVFIILLAGAFTMIIPFVWMLSTSLKEARLVYQIPPEWIPNPIDWHNYVEVFQTANLTTGLTNSAIVSFSVVLFSTFTSTLSAFAFAKLNFPFK